MSLKAWKRCSFFLDISGFVIALAEWKQPFLKQISPLILIKIQQKKSHFLWNLLTSKSICHALVASWKNRPRPSLACKICTMIQIWIRKFPQPGVCCVWVYSGGKEWDPELSLPHPLPARLGPGSGKPSGEIFIKSKAFVPVKGNDQWETRGVGRVANESYWSLTMVIDVFLSFNHDAIL